MVNYLKVSFYILFIRELMNFASKLIQNQFIFFILQTLNIPDAYKDERFDPSVSTRFQPSSISTYMYILLTVLVYFLSHQLGEFG